MLIYTSTTFSLETGAQRLALEIFVISLQPRFIFIIKYQYLTYNFLIFPVHLQFEELTLRDYVLHSIVNNFIIGNFTPTTFAERPCRDDSLPYFLPKHRRSERSKHMKKTKRYGDTYRTFGDYSLKSVDSLSDGYYFRPKYRSYSRDERSVYRRIAKSLRMRRRYLPAKVVSGPLASRTSVLLQWSLNDAVHLDSEGTSVVFR